MGISHPLQLNTKELFKTGEFGSPEGKVSLLTFLMFWDGEQGRYVPLNLYIFNLV